MLEKLDIEIINYLQQSHGVTINQICRKFLINRTTLLYRLNKLQKEELIDKTIINNKSFYIASPTNKIKKIYEKFQEGLNIELGLLSLKDRQVDIITNKPRLSIVNYFDLLDETKKDLEQYYEIDDYSNTELYIDSKEFIYRARNSDVILNNFACNFTKEMLDSLPKLKYMHVSTAMYKYVDVKALKERNVKLSNVPDTYKAVAITEYIIAMTFQMLRHVEDGARQSKAGVKEFRQFIGEELRGKTVAIIGNSHAEFQLYEVLRNLGTEVMVVATDKKTLPKSWGISRYSTIEEIMSIADIIYIPFFYNENYPEVEALDKQFFSKLKKPVYLISVSKHKYIDFDEIRKLLYSGMLKGISLDYFPEISKFSADMLMRNSGVSKIINIPNVYFTPDVAWYTKDSVENLNKYTLEYLIAYIKGDYSKMILS